MWGAEVTPGRALLSRYAGWTRLLTACSTPRPPTCDMPHIVSLAGTLWCLWFVRQELVV